MFEVPSQFAAVWPCDRPRGLMSDSSGIRATPEIGSPRGGARGLPAGVRRAEAVANKQFAMT